MQHARGHMHATGNRLTLRRFPTVDCRSEPLPGGADLAAAIPCDAVRAGVEVSAIFGVFPLRPESTVLFGPFPLRRTYGRRGDTRSFQLAVLRALGGRRRLHVCADVVHSGMHV
jgi:hypothetical protein